MAYKSVYSKIGKMGGRPRKIEPLIPDDLNDTFLKDIPSDILDLSAFKKVNIRTFPNEVKKFIYALFKGFYMTIEDMMAVSGMSRTSIYCAIKSGELVAIQYENNYVIPYQNAIDYMNKRLAEAEEAAVQSKLIAKRRSAIKPNTFFKIKCEHCGEMTRTPYRRALDKKTKTNKSLHRFIDETIS